MPTQIPPMSLVSEDNRILLVIGVNTHDASPDSATFNIKYNDRFQSLPEDISKAYYRRFDGLGIETAPHPLGTGHYLPSPSSSAWSAVDGFLARYHLRKQKLPILTEKTPILAFKTKTRPPLWGTKFMCFLQTPPTNGNHRKFDALFVKNHIQDGTIYLLHDLDVDNLMVLNNPAEAIDSYNAHILSRAEGRFDFQQYGRRI